MNLDDFGDIFQDHFTGETFGESGQLEIIGWNSKCHRSKQYILKCSVCSKDPELYGEGYFKGFRSNMNKGALPCGCAEYKLWTEKQQRVRATRKANSLGYNFVDWASPYKDSKTKMVLLCCDHGLWNTTKLQAMITIGHGCPRCAAKVSSEREMHSEELTIKEVQEKLKVSNYIFLGWAEEYKGKKTKCKIECFDHGIWESTSAANLVSGTSKLGCPQCVSDKIRNTHVIDESIRVQQIQESATRKDLEFIGFVGQYLGDKTKLQLSCSKHGAWETATISNFLRGSSCPSCNGHNQKQCYLNIIYSESLPIAIKFGVSQRFENRLWNQNNKSPLTVVNHSVYLFEESESCKNAERKIKTSLVCGVLDKESFPDGYTETTFLNNIEKIIQIFEFYGGKLL